METEVQKFTFSISLFLSRIRDHCRINVFLGRGAVSFCKLLQVFAAFFYFILRMRTALRRQTDRHHARSISAIYERI